MLHREGEDGRQVEEVLRMGLVVWEHTPWFIEGS